MHEARQSLQPAEPTAPIEDLPARRVEPEDADPRAQIGVAGTRPHRHEPAPLRAEPRSPASPHSRRHERRPGARQRFSDRRPRAPQATRPEERQDRPQRAAARAPRSTEFDLQHLDLAALALVGQCRAPTRGAPRGRSNLLNAGVARSRGVSRNVKRLEARNIGVRGGGGHGRRPSSQRAVACRKRRRSWAWGQQACLGGLGEAGGGLRVGRKRRCSRRARAAIRRAWTRGLDRLHRGLG